MNKINAVALALVLTAISGTGFSQHALADTETDLIAKLTQECKKQGANYELEGEELKNFIADCIEELKAEDTMEPSDEDLFEEESVEEESVEDESVEDESVEEESVEEESVEEDADTEIDE